MPGSKIICSDLVRNRWAVVLIILIFFTNFCVAKKKKLEDMESKLTKLEKTIGTMEVERQENIEAQKAPADNLQQFAEENTSIPLQPRIDMLQKDGLAFRQWSDFLSTFEVDHDHYPQMPIITQSGYGYSFCDISNLGPQLFDYGHSNPNDPWGSPFLYWCSSDGKRCMLVCTGADRKLFFSDKLLKLISTRIMPSELLPQIVSKCAEDDLVWFDGELIQYPENAVEDCEKKE